MAGREGVIDHDLQNRPAGGAVHPGGLRRARLVRALERVPPDAAELREWNDALAYLSAEPSQETAQAARERLIQSLSWPQ